LFDAWFNRTAIDLINGDRFVSFDVEVLFPSIPIDKLEKSLEKWLNCISLQTAKVEGYIKLTGICVK
jgi:hypothetical protein